MKSNAGRHQKGKGIIKFIAGALAALGAIGLDPQDKFSRAVIRDGVKRWRIRRAKNKFKSHGKSGHGRSNRSPYHGKMKLRRFKKTGQLVCDTKKRNIQERFQELCEKRYETYPHLKRKA